MSDEPRRMWIARISRIALHGCVIGAVVVFVFCSRRELDGAANAPSAQPSPPPQLLRDSAYRVVWDFGGVRGPFQSGVPRVVAIRVRNAGTDPWPSIRSTKITPPGAYCVRLGYRWWNADRSKVLADYSGRVELPADLPPGQSVAMIFELTPPTDPGDYQLQFDLVYELVSWFEAKGAAQGFVKVTVQR